MRKNIFTPTFFFVAAVILLSAVLRLVPHWPNFTPIAAMALFAGTYMKNRKLAFAIPMVAMLISDLFLGFHQTMIAVYIGFALIVGVGMMLRSRVQFTTVVLASLGASVIFYLLTNFAVWVSGMVGYPMNSAGLIQCYVAAIPFFRNALLGDIFYTTVFFGSFYLVSRRFPAFAA